MCADISGELKYSVYYPFPHLRRLFLILHLFVGISPLVYFSYDQFSHRPEGVSLSRKHGQKIVISFDATGKKTKKKKSKKFEADRSGTII